VLGSRGGPDELFSASAAPAPDDGTASLSIGFGERVSSMTDKTLRSFDSALRGLVPGGELERRCCGGDNDREEEDLVGLLRSELDAEGIASAHSVAVSVVKRPVPLPCTQPALVPVANTSLVTVWGVAVRGPGDGDADGARMESGGRMLNIWSSE